MGLGKNNADERRMVTLLYGYCFYNEEQYQIDRSQGRNRKEIQKRKALHAYKVK